MTMLDFSPVVADPEYAYLQCYAVAGPGELGIYFRWLFECHRFRKTNGPRVFRPNLHNTYETPRYTRRKRADDRHYHPRHRSDMAVTLYRHRIPQ